MREWRYSSQAFLSTGIYRGQRSAARPGRLSPEKRPVVIFWGELWRFEKYTAPERHLVLSGPVTALTEVCCLIIIHTYMYNIARSGGQQTVGCGTPVGSGTGLPQGRGHLRSFARSLNSRTGATCHRLYLWYFNMADTVIFLSLCGWLVLQSGGVGGGWG